MDMGRTQAEVELTRKLAATLVQREVIEPMAANGWRHGATPTPEQAAVMIAERARAAGEPEDKIAAFLAERGVQYSPPAGGPPATPEGAPAPIVPPAASAQSGQPAPAPVAPAATPTAKTDAPATLAAAQNVLNLMESLRDTNGLIMGKYTSVDEALKGAGHLANMAKTALQRAEQAEARQSVAAPVVAAPPTAVPAVAPVIKPFVPNSRPGLEMAQARLDKVLSKVNEDGFNGDSAREFAEANRELAKEQALAVAEEQKERDEHARHSESAKWKAVNEYMAATYPESVHVDDAEFGLFLQSNPLLTEAMSALRAQGREQRAAELGYTEFAKARGGAPTIQGMTRAEAEKKEIELSAREQVRIEARDIALKDAGIVHGSAGGSGSVETPGITGPSQADIDGLASAMRREGDSPGSRSGEAWRKAVIPLPPEIFGYR